MLWSKSGHPSCHNKIKKKNLECFWERQMNQKEKKNPKLTAEKQESYPGVVKQAL